jgi:hypothetical protein
MLVYVCAPDTHNVRTDFHKLIAYKTSPPLKAMSSADLSTRQKHMN